MVATHFGVKSRQLTQLLGLAEFVQNATTRARGYYIGWPRPQTQTQIGPLDPRSRVSGHVRSCPIPIFTEIVGHTPPEMVQKGPQNGLLVGPLYPGF